MTHDFFEKMYNHPSIKKEDYKAIIDSHKRVEFSKNELLLNEGKTSNEYYLIEKGLFRSFLYDYNGNEITADFFGSNEILIEVASLFLRIPSKENLQALSDGYGWKIEFSDFQNLYTSIDGFTEWGRTWMSNQLFISKQRAINMLTQSATERYLKLTTDQPQIIKHVPLKYIASYLGVTDSSLSRIRKEISQKK
ncbi:Crp/Fnr family transcriptional regulator [Ulvibacter antarcticus]|uniref:CRP-like cAMP-binding protein n=1 Tax=Ulvibacter antarcticus TaxID=442714 RepID=A0A3L9YW06_9FLAO|nr:Crp/Fnr family transcriptional regulator [Ulvibacter antarcticus]RMA64693.1 CRP-like cAMP-binding protein [Ulvibacter antarcticus]